MRLPNSSRISFKAAPLSSVSTAASNCPCATPKFSASLTAAISSRYAVRAVSARLLYATRKSATLVVTSRSRAAVMSCPGSAISTVKLSSIVVCSAFSRVTISVFNAAPSFMLELSTEINSLRNRRAAVGFASSQVHSPVRYAASAVTLFTAASTFVPLISGYAAIYASGFGGCSVGSAEKSSR